MIARTLSAWSASRENWRVPGSMSSQSTVAGRPGVKRPCGDEQPDLLLFEAVHDVLEDGQRLAIGEVGVVNGKQHRSELSQSDDQGVEQWAHVHRGAVDGFGRSRGPRPPRRVPRSPLSRCAAPPRTRRTCSRWRRVCASRTRPRVPAARGPRTAGHTAGGVQDRAATRPPRALDRNAPARHLDRAAEDLLEFP